MKNKTNRKTIALALALAAVMLPLGSYAQEKFERGGGMFCRGESFQSDGLSRSMLNQKETSRGGSFNGTFTNDNFETTPIGSGIAILIGASLGYVALKKKEDNQ